jgi:hypothetical protein
MQACCHSRSSGMWFGPLLIQSGIGLKPLRFLRLPKSLRGVHEVSESYEWRAAVSDASHSSRCPQETRFDPQLRVPLRRMLQTLADRSSSNRDRPVFQGGSSHSNHPFWVVHEFLRMRAHAEGLRFGGKMSLFQLWGALGNPRASLLILPAILRAQSPARPKGCLALK